MVFPIIQVVELGMKLLRELGLTKDPEAEKEYRLRLLEWAARRDVAESEEFGAFLKATTVDAQYVPRWINGIQALTRPALTWLITGSIVAAFFIDGLAARVTLTLKAFGDAGTAGLLLIAIPAWWFFGRSIERIVPGLAMARGMGLPADAPTSPVPFWKSDKNGGALPVSGVPGKPAPVTSAPPLSPGVAKTSVPKPAPRPAVPPVTYDPDAGGEDRDFGIR